MKYCKDCKYIQKYIIKSATLYKEVSQNDWTCSHPNLNNPVTGESCQVKCFDLRTSERKWTCGIDASWFSERK